MLDYFYSATIMIKKLKLNLETLVLKICAQLRLDMFL